MAKLPTRRKVFDLAGEAQANADGSSRQSELLICEPGEEVILRREPDNAYDANAVSVSSVRGICIGYLAKADAAEIAPVLDLGREHRASSTNSAAALAATHRTARGFRSLGTTPSLTPTSHLMKHSKKPDAESIQWRVASVTHPVG